MARPKKWRRVCCMPSKTKFAPVGTEFRSGEAVVMTVDEYETIRLIDLEGLNQEECAANMKIARTTVQQIYNEARGKLAHALVEGRPLLINGGEYRLCEEDESFCGCPRCQRRRGAQKERPNMRKKEIGEMKVIIPVDENRADTPVCVSFGRAPWFLVHDQQTGENTYLENPAAQAEGGAGLLAAQTVVDSGADALLTIRCGENAAEVLQAAGIRIYKTEAPGAAENLTAFREGKLAVMTAFHAGFHGHP